MAPTRTDDHHPFRGFNDSVTRTLGADARLLYGMLVPILVIVDLIILLALNPTQWLVAVIVVLEIGALALVVAGFLDLLSQD